MSDHQDIGSTSARRSTQQKRLIFTSISAFALLLLLIGGVAAVVYTSQDNPSDSSARNLHSTQKSVTDLCASTDYPQTCKSSMSKVVNSSTTDPKELLHAAVRVVSDEVNRAFARFNLNNITDPRIRAAVEDCERLFRDSRAELTSTLDSILARGLEHLPERSHEMTTWLSAVMSYLETCVDGFPEGPLRKEMDKGMVMARQLNSNALVIIKKAAAFLSQLNVPGLSRRRLLDAEGEGFSPDGVPHWIEEGERRILNERAGIKLKPNVTVAQDGSGKYKTITEALKDMPQKYHGRYVIYVKAGIYDETVNLTRKMENVTMYGDGSRKTIVTGSKNFVDGTPTYMTATFAAQGDSFMAIAMGFRNTAGAAKHQAVALRVQSDRSIFLNCRMEGYQDTLYAQAKRQFYRGCIITGTIDFIFGDATAIFQKCIMVARRPLDNQQNIVTAQGRTDRHETTGFVIQNSKFIADEKLKPVAEKIPTYLGRPWKNCSRTIIMESKIGDFVHPHGYLPWDGDFALKTLYYAEYHNSGKGAGVKDRVNWPGFKVIKKEEAKKYTVGTFIQGGDWLKGTGTPVRLNLYH